MSTTVDDRIVSMRFDNQHFEKNVQTSMRSLDKLKQSLDLKGATKGLEDVDRASKRVDMSSLGNAVESVRVKFSALQVMAVTALSNITNSVVNTGKRMISALTIDPISTGFSEYETKINAIQTIMSNTASKGTTMSDVTRVINELNTYADKTIYNFAEMTRNIGTFTAAGVGLEESASAIQGIANLAAASGSSSQQASTAMYQLSQALAAGTVKLMDWNSVVNAGMGGQKFQDALKATARDHGIAVDELIEKNGSFRESLSEGWISADILNETLNKFTVDGATSYAKSMMESGKWTQEQADALIEEARAMEDAATKVKTFTQLWDTLKESAQSGWSQSWEIIIGDFEEAKEFLTKISDTIGGMIGASADARNQLLSGGLRTGWDQLIGAGIADEAGFKDTLMSMSDSTRTFFETMEKTDPESTFEERLSLAFKKGKVDADMLSKSVFKMAREMNNMSEAEREAAGYTEDHINQINELAEGLKNGTVSMDKFAEMMQKPSGRENLIQALWNAFDGLMSIVNPIKEAFREVFPPATAEQLYALTERIRDLTAKFKLSEDQAEKLKSTFKGIFSVISIIVSITKEVTSGIIRLLKYIINLDSILEKTGSLGEWITGVKDAAKETGVFGLVVDKVVGFIEKAIDKIRQFLSFVKTKIAAPGFEGFLKLMSSIWAFVQKIAGKIASFTSTISSALGDMFMGGDFNAAIGLFNGGLLAGILLSVKKFADGFKSIGEGVKGFKQQFVDILDGVKGCFEAWQKDIQSNIILKIAASILILAIALAKIATIDPERLFGALAGVAALFGELIGALALFNKIPGEFKNARKAVNTMIGMSLAVLILASALTKIAVLDLEELGIGLLGVAGLMLVVVAAAKMMANTKGLVKGGLQMILMASALKILASVCSDLSKLSWEGLAKGIAGVGALLLEFVVFLKLTKLSTGAMTNAVGIVIMAAALKILASVCKDLSRLSWEGLAKGIAGVGALLLEFAIFLKLTKLSVSAMTNAVGVLVMAAALKILASVCKDLSQLSWEGIKKGLAGVGGLLLEFSLCMKIMGKNNKNIYSALGTIIVMAGFVAALLVLVHVFKDFASMSWDNITHGLAAMGGAMLILAVGLKMMKRSLSGAVALTIAAVAISIFAGVLAGLSTMSWDAIAKGLGTLAGVFIILGVAGYVLSPVVTVILALSASLVVLGVGCMAIGSGLLLVAAGFAALAAATSASAKAIVAGISIIILGILNLVPEIAAAIGRGIVEFLRIISTSAPALREALKEIVLLLIGVFTECIPPLVDGILQMVAGLLSALVEYTPQIVDSIFQFILGILDGIAKNLPALIQGLVDILMALFSGTIDALSTVDPEVFVKGIGAVGVLTAVMAALAACAALAPAAMLGVVGIVAVLAEIGLISQIPGLSWLISEGAELGKSIGEAIGGLVGGFAEALTSVLPQIASNLSGFVTNIQPFIDGLRSVDGSVLAGAATLAGALIAITAASLVEGIASFLTGGSSLVSFSAQLVPFGLALSAFSKAVSGVDPVAVMLAATAGKAIVEMTNAVPNEGGVRSWFSGDSGLAAYTDNLVPFGEALVGFSNAVAGVNAPAVVMASMAGKAIIDMTNTIPNEGGMKSWFSGDSGMAAYAGNLAPFAEGLVAFSTAATGINLSAVTTASMAGKAIIDMTNTIPNEGGIKSWFSGESGMAAYAENLAPFARGLAVFSVASEGINLQSVTAASAAGKAIVDMTNTIPNEGGIKSWFSGESGMAAYAGNLAPFAKGLASFSVAAEDINTPAVMMAVMAGKALIDMTNAIPNEGGIKSWFSGDSGMAAYAGNLAPFAKGLALFSEAAIGINLPAVVMASMAGKAIIDMTNTIPNEGGMKSWFSGESGMAAFAENLAPFAKGLAAFSIAAEGINVPAVMLASMAGKAIISMTNTIPNEGGIQSWFAGESSMASYAGNLGSLGEGLASFAAAVVGIDAEAVTAAVTAGKAIISMTNTIPNEGGIQSWFAGESSMASYAGNLGSLGEGLASFAAAVSGIDTEAVTAAATAGKTISDMTNTIPNEGGIKSWFSGDSGMAAFADNLEPLGEGLADFSVAVSDIKPANVTAAANAAKTLATMTNSVPKNTDKLESFGKNLVTFGEKMVEFFTDMSEVSDSDTSSSAAAVEAVKDITEIKSSGITSVTSAVKNFTTTVGEMRDSVGSDFKKAGADAVRGFIDAVKGNIESAKTVCDNLITKCVTQIRNRYQKFKDSGKYLVQGFVKGIREHIYLAEGAARDLGIATLKALAKELLEASPSKATEESGEFFDMGFINGIRNKIRDARTASSDLGDAAVAGLNAAIEAAGNIFNSDLDSQPVIRPVIDMSNVSSGVNAINGMFGMRPSVGLLANVGSISSMMNANQNGSDSDIISAINDLGRKIGNMSRNSYVINGVTYDDGTNVSSAVESLVRAVRIERRS